jgi:hypothetical protein
MVTHLLTQVLHVCLLIGVFAAKQHALPSAPHPAHHTPGCHSSRPAAAEAEAAAGIYRQDGDEALA